MIQDQRLRLLGTTPDTAQATAALDAFDSVHVVVEPGEDVHAAQIPALIALVAMLGRLVGNVTVTRSIAAPRNWWGVRAAEDIVAVVQRLRPDRPHPPGQELRVTVGARGVRPGDLGVGGGDWTATIAPGPAALEPSTHALGLHAAACLAVGQVLNRVLGPHGYPGVVLDAPYALDLITHRPIVGAAPAPGASRASGALKLAVAGVGSVGTSTLALLAMAVAAPHVGPTRPDLRVTAIDGDSLDPARNPFRYPALCGGEQGNKAIWMTARLREFGITAHAAPCGVGEWAVSRLHPGFDGLLVSSVDTVPGRLDVADVLARETLSLGVSGLALHAQRERFADGLACPFCDYVAAEPPATQAQVYASLTGLPVARVLQLLHADAHLTGADLDVAVAAGHVPEHRGAALVGFRLADLVREAYAEAPLRTAGSTGDGAVAVAAPHVSWFAGVLAAVEVLKQLNGLPVLDRRVDVDLGGLRWTVSLRAELAGLLRGDDVADLEMVDVTELEMLEGARFAELTVLDALEAKSRAALQRANLRDFLLREHRLVTTAPDRVRHLARRAYEIALRHRLRQAAAGVA